MYFKKIIDTRLHYLNNLINLNHIILIDQTVKL